MNKLQFRKLIREEIRSVLNEKLVARRGGVDLLPENVGITMYKDGYYLECEIEDASKVQKAINLLRKLFAEIQPNLEAELVGQPKIYKTSSGYTRYDGPIDVVGLKFKTSLTFDEILDKYPMHTANRKDYH